MSPPDFFKSCSQDQINQKSPENVELLTTVSANKVLSPVIKTVIPIMTSFSSLKIKFVSGVHESTELIWRTGNPVHRRKTKFVKTLHGQFEL